MCFWNAVCLQQQEEERGRGDGTWGGRRDVDQHERKMKSKLEIEDEIKVRFAVWSRSRGSKVEYESSSGSKPRGLGLVWIIFDSGFALKSKSRAKQDRWWQGEVGEGEARSWQRGKGEVRLKQDWGEVGLEVGWVGDEVAGRRRRRWVIEMDSFALSMGKGKEEEIKKVDQILGSDPWKYNLGES